MGRQTSSYNCTGANPGLKYMTFVSPAVDTLFCPGPGLACTESRHICYTRMASAINFQDFSAKGEDF